MLVIRLLTRLCPLFARLSSLPRPFAHQSEGKSPYSLPCVLDLMLLKHNLHGLRSGDTGFDWLSAMAFVQAQNPEDVALVALCGLLAFLLGRALP